MTEEQPKQPTPTDAWRDVGEQFEALGKSLATAFRAAWESEENRQRAQKMQTGLEALVNQVGDAIQEAAASPEAHKARTEAEKAAESLRAASQKTWQESRPHLVSALRQVNDELQKMIGQLEREEPGRPAAETPGEQHAE